MIADGYGCTCVILLRVSTHNIGILQGSRILSASVLEAFELELARSVRGRQRTLPHVRHIDE